MSAPSFSAELARDEAVLRFPYDDRLRRLLRAIPGRRWDPGERAWCVPLGPDQAEALARLFAGLAPEPQVSAELDRKIARRRARRRREECLVDLARPDQDWWLSFATDGAGEQVATLLGHPDARELPAIGRALVPLDEQATGLLEQIRGRGSGLRLSEPAQRALRELEQPQTGNPPVDRTAPREHAADVEFRRDRRGGHWILVGGRHARLARVLAGRIGLRAAEGPAGTVGLEAVEHDADVLQGLLGELEDAVIDPRVFAWLARAREWRGNIEVEGSSEAPDVPAARRPRAPAERAARARGEHSGRGQPAAHARLLARDRGRARWLDERRRQTLRGGARAGAPGAPGGARELRRPRAADVRPRARPRPAAARGVRQAPRRARRRGRRGAPSASTPTCRRSGRTRSACPSSTASSPSTASGSRPEALVLLQEIREQHARAAGLVALSAAAEDALEVPGLGGELKPFQRAGVRYLLERRRAFLADEQGLGKTIEALATIEAAGAYPAVVVCPASLKLNWLRELERWLPRTPGPRPLGWCRRGRRRRGRGHGRQLRHPLPAAGGAIRPASAGARARRVPLLQERRPPSAPRPASGSPARFPPTASCSPSPVRP